MAERYGMLVDLNRCIGCQACIIACKQENGLPPNTDDPPGTKGSSWIRVTTVGPEGTYPHLSMYYLPMLCAHCENPPCLAACPDGAIYKRADGLVLIDPDRCTACEECVSACPYEACQLDGRQGVVRKCTLCAQRVDVGLAPACAQACVGGAMFFGDLGDPDSPVSRAVAAAADTVFVLKPADDARPGVVYAKPRQRQ